jgi:glycosyltransferase involved in cell wall biosynthesis
MNDKRNSKPQVSIIITVYNRLKVFEKALNSALNQSFTDSEIIIVNDGSTDDFHIEIMKYLKYDYRLKYFYQANAGTVKALNSGINISNGKYITFLDSDDEYKSDHIESRVDYMNANPYVDLIHSNALLIGEESDFMVPDADNPGRLIHVDDCIIGGTFFGKHKVFSEYFIDVFSYDSEFIRRVSGKYKVRKFLNPTYIYYRNSVDGILNKIKKEI